MKESRKDLVDAILYYAEKYNSRKNYVALMKTYPGLTKIVEMIVYEMFLNYFNSYYCDIDDYK